MLKRLFLQMDDTTVLNWHGQLASASVDQVKKLGVPVTLMSSRSAQEMLPLVEQLGASSAQVALNGGLIYRLAHGQVQPLLTQALLKKNVYYLLKSLMTVFPDLCQSYFTAKHWVAYRDDDKMQAISATAGMEPLLVGPAAYLHPQLPVIKIQLAPSSTQERVRLQQFFDYLAIPNFKVQLTVQGVFEISSQSLNLASTVQQVMVFDGLHNDEIVGFGEDWNQLPFLPHYNDRQMAAQAAR